MRADSWTDLARNLQSGRASEQQSCVYPRRWNGIEIARE